MFYKNLKYQIKTWQRQIKEFLHLKKEQVKYQKKYSKSIQKIRRVDQKDIPNLATEIRLFAIFRNESLRLPYFFEYYKKLGLDRFFFIDNNSTDNSSEIINKEPNTHLFFTNESYTNHWQWMEYLLDTFGKNHWCLVVDIDELFSFPNSERITLKELITYLENSSSESVASLLLDMYSDSDLEDIKYKNGDNPLDFAPYFDSEYYKSPFVFYDRKHSKNIFVNVHTGGMRERVFGKMNPFDILTKISLFKYNSNVYLVQGMHAITGTKPADIEGCVFHTKFLNDFIEEVKEETTREQHYGNAIYYKHYLKTINLNKNLTLFYDKSVKFKNTEQLIKLNLMKTSEKFEKYCLSLKANQ